MVRLSNASEVQIEDVVVRFPSQIEEYGNIPPNGATDFREVELAYRYAYVHGLIDGQKAICRPIDYVGERRLRPGRYTYVLTFDADVNDEWIPIHIDCRKQGLKMIKDY